MYPSTTLSVREQLRDKLGKDVLKQAGEVVRLGVDPRGDDDETLLVVLRDYDAGHRLAILVRSECDPTVANSIRRFQRCRER